MSSDSLCNQRRTVCFWLAVMLTSSCQRMPVDDGRAAVALEVVLDGSVGVGERCQELLARIDDVLALPGVRRLEVAAVQTGDRSVGYEPITLLPWRAWDTKAGLYASKNRLAAERSAWLTQIGRDCEASLRPVGVSAIVTAAQRAAGSLRSHCSELEQHRIRCSRQILAIHSDLRENVDARTARSLDRGILHDPHVKDMARADNPDLPAIDVAGLDVRVCGVAATAVGKHEKLIDPAIVTSIWKAILGVDADRFDSICRLGTTTRERL
jgi:hypothetical protein